MDKPKLRARTLGKRIAEAYKARGWNRSQFHRALQASDPALASLAYTSIRSWESGEKEPRINTLSAVARLTGYTLDELTALPADDQVPDAGSESDAVLSDEQVSALLDKLGASDVIKAEVQQELAAYPPKRLTHFEVVRVHRIMTKSHQPPPHPENLDADAQLARMGLPGRADQKDLREHHAAATKRSKASADVTGALKTAKKRLKNG